MPKTLIIAEKPSVARDIAAALGKVAKKGEFFENDTYVITSAVGHLVELYMPQDYDKKFGRWTLQNLPIVPDPFGLKPIERSAKQFNLVKKLLKRKDVELAINACDAGREGELIFTYLYELAEAKVPFKRLWMQSMTPTAIREAFEHLRTPEQMLPLQEAARCRSEADWLVGINGTRAITSRLYGARVKELATVGRVQTPTLSMVIERERAIRAFKPVSYWRIAGKFDLQQGTYEGLLQKDKTDDKNPDDKPDRLWNEAEAKALLERILAQKSWAVTETLKREERIAPKLYDLTTLQREANSRFGFSAAGTLKIAQALYERHKALTYPRTDSQALPEDYIGVVKKTLSRLQGEIEPFAQKAVDWVRPNKRIFNNAKISDHFAIIPTGEIPGDLKPEEAKIYDMVCRRFVAIFFPPAQIDNTTRLTTAATPAGTLTFRTEGKVLVEPGWMAVHGRVQLESEPLVPLTPADNASAALQGAELQADATRPPARYTEATLLSAMESAGKMVDDEELAEAMKERGLGTPATRANIIDHIINTGYIVKDRQALIPTPKAETLYDFLKVLRADALTRPDLTGEWEYRLRQMEERKLSRGDFMKGIADQARAIVEAARKFEESNETATETAVMSPTDGKPLLENTRFYTSQDGKFKIWKVMNGRKMSLDEIGDLLKNGSVGPLEGFVSKFGRKFSAKLKLDENMAAKFDFEGSAPRITVTVDQLKAGEKLGRCPNDDGDVHAHEGGYACECAVGEKPTCGFKLPKTLLGRELPKAEVVKLLNKEETSPLEGFVSKKNGRKFTAILYLRMSGKQKGQLGWKFPPRPKKAKGEKSEENPSENSASAESPAPEKPAKPQRPKGEDVPF